MKITITSIDKVRQQVYSKKYTRLISILNPFPRPKLFEFPELDIDVKTYEFFDVESAWQEGAPTKWHIEQLLEDSKSIKDGDDVLIHCTAGISRSTAAAISILIQRGMSISDAFNHVKEIRPIACPNTLVLYHTDNALKLNGKLYEYAEKFLNDRLIKAKF